jgi:hypothetical protein
MNNPDHPDHPDSPDSRCQFTFRVDQRELATILAALRFHQDENLQGGGDIPDKAVSNIATDGGTLQPLDFAEVEGLCQRLNLDAGTVTGLHIAPPPVDADEGQGLFRVVYEIDLHAADARDAAEQAYEIMADPQSLPPVLEIVSPNGQVVTIDLSNS